MTKALHLLRLIKFEHTVFAFPFAIISAFLAAQGMPSLKQLLLICAAMLGARTAGMGFNRILDRELDKLNPRTQNRELCQGAVRLKEAWLLVILSSVLFLVAACSLNRLTALLSPFALATVLLYSYAKRFTNLTHLLLGFCLGIAPMGAWIAVTGSFAWEPALLSAAVILWVMGFDIIYACQDIEFDRRVGIFSIPANFGVSPALWLSRASHLGMVLALLYLHHLAHLGLPFLLGLGLVALFLIYEHTLIRPHDLSRVNLAFFTVNGFVSILLMLFALWDIFMRGGV